VFCLFIIRDDRKLLSAEEKWFGLNKKNKGKQCEVRCKLVKKKGWGMGSRGILFTLTYTLSSIVILNIIFL
jgi:hypothetical protein